MITSKEVRKINAKYNLHYVDEYEIVDKYLKQQEKVNELLKLKELYYKAKLKKQYYSLVLDTHPTENKAKYTKLCKQYLKQIKDLEAELNE